MAKRKRLSPAAPIPDAPDGPLETKALNGWVGVRAPIANVSADASVRAALDEVSSELAEARATGRMIVPIVLDAIDDSYLVRDRASVDQEDMDVLRDSLRARGQQTPIEVVELDSGRYGLISGWRRLMALRELHAEAGEDRFAKVSAVVRFPETAADAYLAMVEENEVRANLSFYERARIAVKGDERLRFPANIPEKLGLAIAAKLKADQGFRRQLSEALRKSSPANPASERALLERYLKSDVRRDRARVQTVALTDSLSLQIADRKVTLSGSSVSPDLVEDLRAWLESRARSGK